MTVGRCETRGRWAGAERGAARGLESGGRSWGLVGPRGAFETKTPLVEASVLPWARELTSGRWRVPTLITTGRWDGSPVQGRRPVRGGGVRACQGHTTHTHYHFCRHKMFGPKSRVRGPRGAGEAPGLQGRSSLRGDRSHPGPSTALSTSSRSDVLSVLSADQVVSSSEKKRNISHLF